MGKLKTTTIEVAFKDEAKINEILAWCSKNGYKPAEDGYNSVYTQLKTMPQFETLKDLCYNIEIMYVTRFEFKRLTEEQVMFFQLKWGDK